MKRWLTGGLCGLGLGTLVVLNLMTLRDLRNVQPAPDGAPAPIGERSSRPAEPPKLDSDVVPAALPGAIVASALPGATDPFKITAAGPGLAATDLSASPPITAGPDSVAVTFAVAETGGTLPANSKVAARRVGSPTGGGLDPAPVSLNASASASLTFKTTGAYEIFLQDNAGVDKFKAPGQLTILSTAGQEQNPRIESVVESVSTVTGGAANEIYITPFRSSSVKLRSRSALTLQLSGTARDVALVDGDRAIASTSGLDANKQATFSLTGLAPGNHDIQIVDRWQPDKNPSSRVTIVIPDQNSPAAPTLGFFATDKNMGTSAISGKVSTYGNFLRVAGQQGTPNQPPQFISYIQSGSAFVREDTDIVATINSVNGANWDVNLRLPTQSLRTPRRLVALREEGPGFTYATPLAYDVAPFTFLDTVGPPTIGTISTSDSTLTVTNPGVNGPKAFTNAAMVKVLAARPAGVGNASGFLTRSHRDGVVTLPLADNVAGTEWAVAALPLLPGTNQITVSLVQGDRVGPISAPLTIEMHTPATRAKVVSAYAPTFGSAVGPQTVTITFDGGPMDKTSVETPGNYTLQGSGGAGTAFQNATPANPEANPQYDPASNSVTLKFSVSKVDIYQVVLTSSSASGAIKDVYGNPLDSGSLTHRLGATAGGAGGGTTAIPPSNNAPFVPYKEYTDPRAVSNGFNPSDKVETRVVRLYYYRDAHRVAQIVNRDLRAWNFAAVDTRRRLADEKRRDADKLTDERRLQETRAERAARETRAAEAKLAQAQQQFDAANRQATQAPAEVARLQAEADAAHERVTDAETNLSQQQQALTNAANAPAATQQAAQDAVTDAKNSLATRKDEERNVRARLQDAQRLATSGIDALPNLRAQIPALQADVQAKRAAEGDAAVTEIADQQKEDRAREEQFRLEVAAAHEDPDHFAAGVPDSDDPVQQVSVSVIGEGLIQLRGPIKGVNIIRIMINQIDTPAGQVRVGIHTVQVNGEKGKRMEAAVGKIKDDIDHSRFLTVQSAQMLRNAVVRVASRKADLVAQQCRAQGVAKQSDSQKIRDRMYIDAFFGRDFLMELEKIDSEFLMTGNKVLSLHSMDTTSLASAMFLMALAKTSVRAEIVSEFKMMMATDLPEAERTYYLAGGPQAKKHGGGLHHKQAEPLMACNARFESFLGYFRDIEAADDTLSPIQREFIRLAQIFKSQLVTELEYNQRVKERAIIEQRLGNRIEELTKQKEKDETAQQKLLDVQEQMRAERVKVLGVGRDLTEEIRIYQSQAQESLDTTERHIKTLGGIFAKLERALAADRTGIAGLPDPKPAAASDSDNPAGQLNAEFKRLARKKTGSEPTREEVLSTLDVLGQAFDLNAKAQRQPSAVAPSEKDKIEELANLLNELRKRNIKLYFDFRSAPDKLSRFYFDPQNGSLQREVDAGSTEEASRARRSKDLKYARDFFFKAVRNAQMQEEFLRNMVWDQDFSDRLEKGGQLLATMVDELVDPTVPLTLKHFVQLAQAFDYFEPLSRTSLKNLNQFDSIYRQVTASLAKGQGSLAETFRQWALLRREVLSKTRGELREKAKPLIEKVDSAFANLLNANLAYEFAKQNAEESRQPLDHKKLLDMLVDELEEKYIELLEGTRAHTANMDNYIKGLATALDDDLNTQFYAPAFRRIRETGGSRDVQFAQIESTSILTNNRMFGKVVPQATMEFDLPKRDIAIVEAMNGAKAVMDDFGALVNDPTFLALTKLRSGQPTSSPAQGTTSGGVSSVRNVLPGLPRQNDEEVFRQAGPGRREFGSAMEALIPDPAVYKFETGTGYEIRPVIQPDGQAVVFHFNYMYTTNVREPVRPDEKHLGRVKRQFIDDEVQLSNYELREVSTYRVGLKAARTGRGIPLFEDIPGAGVLFRPLPSAESSLQENIILAQATIFPTLFDLMGLRWAPAVADLDTMGLRNADFIVRGRGRYLQNQVFDKSTNSVDDFMRIPPAQRRPDLYRTQQSIPDRHPNGYQGPGLDLRDSKLREGYKVEDKYPESRYIPRDSREMPEEPTRREPLEDDGVVIDGEVVPLPEDAVLPGQPSGPVPGTVVPPSPEQPIMDPSGVHGGPGQGVPHLEAPAESGPPMGSRGLVNPAGSRVGRAPGGSNSMSLRQPARPTPTAPASTANLPPLPRSSPIANAGTIRDPNVGKATAPKTSPAAPQTSNSTRGKATVAPGADRSKAAPAQGVEPKAEPGRKSLFSRLRGGS